MTDVSDEAKQQAFNQLDDYLPEAPPGSPPYSPTSPEYSLVCTSPSPIMDYPDWTSETTYNNESSGDDNNDEPLVE